MRSDGFQYLKENFPYLQSELLKTVAGCDERGSGGGGGKSHSVWAQYSNGEEMNDRSIGQLNWENMGVGTQSLWAPLSNGRGDGSSSRDPFRQEENLNYQLPLQGNL
ncbi:hypothetical protein SAY87_027295 [Trapa incisa]|uniref:Uncharacterized protein n=1 Tax=Trapa incisa TaxID=236973 RepID=A0AAN7GN40_9MYRT|nr:hypothetical protein SAY87_027295 [Trapa incisa]